MKLIYFHVGSKQELSCLREGVHSDRLRRLQQPLWNRRELLQDKLANPELDTDEKAKLKEQIEELDENISRVA